MPNENIFKMTHFNKMEPWDEVMIQVVPEGHITVYIVRLGWK